MFSLSNLVYILIRPISTSLVSLVIIEGKIFLPLWLVPPYHQVHITFSTLAPASQMTLKSHPLWTTTALLTALHNAGTHLGNQPMTAFPRTSLPDAATVHTPSLTWRPTKPLNTDNSSVIPKFKDALNTSTASEFRCLAQGVGGLVKRPTPSNLSPN